MPKKIPNRELKRLSREEFRNSSRMPAVLVLDNVRSQHNIGSAFRTADAFAIEHICLCGITACPPSAEIHKSALGAEDTMEWTYYENTLDAVRELQQKGYVVYAVEQAEGAIDLEHFIPERHQKTALVFGNEVRGVRQEVVDACNACLEIPQHGTKHSLNVSVAIGVVLWHCYLAIRV
ncbi:MAG TPA: RNA methyltransferase [Bacteroidales bacterium]|nr:MAG: putative TrmH family tRNA/rRNA methyltransferase [Bacteroidetes bacterium ADurb.Bin037]HPV87875.1 RNA methyltransferase [Bacteroidales bacterium]HPW78079.1 RNA methyltransferase [Bacteroidales bacterium]HQB56581.1 RNA methyltransferase [Bacteroidales bacterium]